MPTLMRAAAAALVALALVPADAVRAQETEPVITLPAQRARPPADREPAAQANATAESSTPVAPAVQTRATAETGRAGPAPERWESISVETANAGTYALPVGRGHAGPSVLHAQVLLDRALFSPGMIDGRWGKNTEHAVLWFQAREGLPETGVVDSATHARLVSTAGEGPTVVEHVLTEDDVRGPFVRIPADIYEHARLTCSCYESLAEKLTERFHASERLLTRLNPGVDLDTLAAGARLFVPVQRDASAPPAGEVRQIVVSGSGNYLQALDSAGRILYHFPATLGSSFDPSPSGDFAVTSIHPNPWWHYQPRLLAHVPDHLPNARIPPGPNNAVGRVWMALSAPHYGIHGTKSPETIGYAVSAGCVRLTNWDVVFLSTRVRPGTPVAFRDTRDEPAAAPAPAAPQPPAEPPAVLGRARGQRAGGHRHRRARHAAHARPRSARHDGARPIPGGQRGGRAAPLTRPETCLCGAPSRPSLRGRAAFRRRFTAGEHR